MKKITFVSVAITALAVGLLTFAMNGTGGSVVEQKRGGSVQILPLEYDADLGGNVLRQQDGMAFVPIRVYINHGPRSGDLPVKFFVDLREPGSCCGGGEEVIQTFEVDEFVLADGHVFSEVIELPFPAIPGHHKIRVRFRVETGEVYPPEAGNTIASVYIR